MDNLNRSYVICHMMSTIDGKIDSGIKGKDILGDYYSLYSQLEHELKPQAWMCGRVTSEMFAESVGTPLPESNQVIDDNDFQSSLKGSNFMITVDTKGVLRWNSNVLTFEDKSEHQLIIIVTSETPKNYLAYLQEKNITYIFNEENKINFEELFKKLKTNFYINILALEGGGILNGSVMAANLVDEISLIVTPIVLNRSNSPSVFERDNGEELDVKKYSLTEVKQLDQDSVWLRYKRNPHFDLD